jgi:hypothetical protein
MMLAGWIVYAPSPATAFGTIDGAGQHREHERISRDALACHGDGASTDDCFEARSIDQLAGRGQAFGAVGAPDSDEVSNPAAHCDDADFLPHNYPRNRQGATQALSDCVDHMRGRFREAVRTARGMVDRRGNVIADEVGLDSDCRFSESRETRAKCATIEAFGRALHGAQDFYSHSNWADEADPTRPIGADNPPGLNRPGPSALLDLRRARTPDVPDELATGCFVLRDEVIGVAACAERITHAGLNKDNGLIDPVTGSATDPTTPRGLVKENFAKAVAGAVAETRRQWADLRSELTDRYGSRDGPLMICALSRDDPVDGCTGHRPSGAVAVGFVAVGVVLATTVFLLRIRLVRSV